MPAVPEEERSSAHYTPVYILNRDGILDVEGYVPKETILYTGAAKVILSKTFAAAMQVNSRNLRRGVEFMTASGAIEMPLGTTNTKLKFTLARGTDHEHVVELHAIVVDTTAYDVILGMEFVAAVRGAYDAYTELFTYRWEDGSGKLRAHSLSAPCHTAVLPVIAYACFGGLISNAAELHDVLVVVR